MCMLQEDLLSGLQRAVHSALRRHAHIFTRDRVRVRAAANADSNLSHPSIIYCAASSCAEPIYSAEIPLLGSEVLLVDDCVLATQPTYRFELAQVCLLRMLLHRLRTNILRLACPP